MSELKTKQLKDAAKELNDVLGLTDPPIKTVGVKTEDLKEAILEAAGLIEEGEEENFTQDTLDVITALQEQIEDDPEAEEAEAETEEPEAEAETEAETEEPEEKPVKKAKAPKKEKAAKAEKAPKKEKPVKKEKTPSAYGTAIEILSKDPDMDSKTLIAKVKKKGIDVDKGHTAINTAYSQFRKVVKLLREAGMMQ